jgi:hypothetical protein
MWSLSQFVPASTPSCVPTALTVNYHLILFYLPAALLIASLLCCKALGLHPKAKDCIISASESSSSSTTSREMFNHERAMAQDIDVVPSTGSIELQKESIVQETKRVKQPYDAFLVLDVEATCLEGELHMLS